MTETGHDYRRTAEAACEDDAEFGNAGRSPDVLPGAGMFWTAVLTVAIIAAGAWMAFG